MPQPTNNHASLIQELGEDMDEEPLEAETMDIPEIEEIEADRPTQGHNEEEDVEAGVDEEVEEEDTIALDKDTE